MMSKVWKNTNDTKVWNRRERVCCLLVLSLVSSTLPCIRQPRPRLAQGMKDSTRYEKCAQGIQLLHKGMKCFFKVWNTCFLEKQWFSIPLWVYFISFWVRKKLLFFPDVGSPFLFNISQAHWETETLLVTTVTEVSPSRFVVCRRSGDHRAAI